MNRKTKVGVKLFALTGVMLSVSATSFAATFMSKQGYRMTPPAGFTARKGLVAAADVLFLRADGSSLSVIVNPAPGTTQLGPSMMAARAQMARTMSHYKALGQGKTTIGGSPAVTLISSFMIGTPPKPVRTLSVLTLHGGKVYAFTCGSPAAIYGRYDAAFKKALASVRWTR